MVTWELSEDSQFPLLEEGLPEEAKFASMWATKDPARVTETKIFQVLMESSLRMAINQRPRLSPTLYMQLLAYSVFKVDFHQVYIQARKDTQQKWHDLPYLVTETDVQKVVRRWSWRAPSDIVFGPSISAKSDLVKKRKEAVKEVR